MSEKLRACPMCGNTDVRLFPDTSYDSAYICCANCDLTITDDRSDKAMKAWNHRHTDAALGDILNNIQEFMDELPARDWSVKTKYAIAITHYQMIFNQLKKLRDGE